MNFTLMLFLFCCSLQEVKSQPQNMLLDALFDDPWSNAFRLSFILYLFKPYATLVFSTNLVQSLYQDYYGQT